ncbi:MAG: hypothetical protein MJD61_07015 [Proteobacteria bacterium]|nr:hypothetical protein [Pseudomonadota bacterium]
MPTGNHYYDDEALARVAKVPLRRVRQWRARGLLPFAVRPAGTRKNLYPVAQVHAWLEGRAADWGTVRRDDGLRFLLTEASSRIRCMLADPEAITPEAQREQLSLLADVIADYLAG